MKHSGIALSSLPVHMQNQIAGMVGGSSLAPQIAADKRIRQKTAPKLNKLESEYSSILRPKYPETSVIFEQAVKLRLANGLTYTPDFVVTGEAHPVSVYEVKGPHAFDGALDKLKMAASVYRHWFFWLVWKDAASKEWKIQRVLP